jgi:hypothetical protein
MNDHETTIARHRVKERHFTDEDGVSHRKVDGCVACEQSWPCDAYTLGHAMEAAGEIERIRLETQVEAAAQAEARADSLEAEKAVLIEALDKRVWPVANDHWDDCIKTNGHGCDLQNVFTELERILANPATSSEEYKRRVGEAAVEAALGRDRIAAWLHANNAGCKFMLGDDENEATAGRHGTSTTPTTSVPPYSHRKRRLRRKRQASEEAAPI